jgi:ubiquinone biosynthesis accessory factor UbiK
MKQTPLEELSGKIGELLANSPAKDIEKNLRAVFHNVTNKLDLVPREEFEIQQAVLQKTRDMVETLETRVAALERQLNKGSDA